MRTDKLFETLRLPPQTAPPPSSRETLRTMYDLPSEDPKEPGLLDEFYYYQPQLLRETFQPPQYAPEHFFVGADLNRYCSVRRPIRRYCMTPFIQRIVMGLAVLTCLALSSSLPCAAETSKVGSATKQVGSGAKQVGRGVEDTAKGVGNTVVEGAKVAGEKIQEAGKTAQPQVEDTLNKVKDGAESAGANVKNFFNKLFGK